MSACGYSIVFCIAKVEVHMKNFLAQCEMRTLIFASSLRQVSGRETPSFMVSTGEAFPLEVRVTANSEPVPNTNAKHTDDHWTFHSTNWFEGTSEFLVTLPRTDVMYVAQLQVTSTRWATHVD